MAYNSNPKITSYTRTTKVHVVSDQWGYNDLNIIETFIAKANKDSSLVLGKTSRMSIL